MFYIITSDILSFCIYPSSAFGTAIPTHGIDELNFLFGSYMAVYEVEYALITEIIQNYKIEIKMKIINELK